jgi:hypothetical protein
MGVLSFYYGGFPASEEFKQSLRQDTHTMSGSGFFRNGMRYPEKKYRFFENNFAEDKNWQT